MNTRSKTRASARTETPSQSESIHSDSQDQPANNPRYSPDWDLPDSLASDNSETEYRPSMEPQSSRATPNPSDLEDEEAPNPGDDLFAYMEAAPDTVQSQNARSPRWLSWQDRLLIRVVEQLRPFTAMRVR
ncbi:hypothetical protein K438DRAFT_1985918 [Mycena galopus ATCC 62051]|nr:hypothetical protein K438DRAFT_1985918 [Mycena galopus ATCC 62051]